GPPKAPQMMPAMAIPLPPPDSPPLAIWFSPMTPKMMASTDGSTTHAAGNPMIPRTSDATQNPLLVPAASRVVPSMVKGMPQPLQLLAEMGLSPEQRGHLMVCLPSLVRRIPGARSPAAA